MAYATGSTDTVQELIDLIKLFAVTEAGYTDAGQWVDGAYTIDGLTKDGFSYIFRNNNSSTVLMNLPDSITPNTSWAAQTGRNATDGCAESLVAPFIKYYLFTIGTNVFCTVECQPGRFNHLAFGQIQKAGSWTGGSFVAGQTFSSTSFNSAVSTSHGLLLSGIKPRVIYPTAASALFRVENDGRTHSLRSPDSGAHGVAIPNFFDAAGRYILTLGAVPFNRRAPMLEAQVFLRRSDMSGAFSPLGVIEGIRILNIQALNPAEVVNNNWMVFPVAEKNGNAVGWLNSGGYGFAFEF